ncbi:hypothetical protein [Pseudolabrys sp. Root1462]|uniref:hypothetical protein n=1 Tax=Pseudolabrys sp. Root1462 TaxID=1736466 RepID=UPI0012E330D3|nr:hypothetical protein [Pseudolabrys sp. Root1462]
MDKNFRCPNIKRTGAALSIRVNPVTQKIQVTTVESNGDWFPGTRILESCSVVDSENWVCATESKSAPEAAFKIYVKSTVGMFRGHLYTIVEGGAPPDYYSSSIGGWRLKLFEWGAIDRVLAQKLE